LIFLTIITGILAGSYPAFYISSFKPAEVLKGKFSLGSATGRLRQVLVIFQFVIAIVLVCGVFVIYKQLSFMKEKDLGFNPEAKVIIPLRTAEAKRQYETLKNMIAQMSAVEAVSAAMYPPGSQVFNDMMFYRDGGSMETAILNRRNMVDAGYLELLDIKMIAGRSFTNNREVESQNRIILNRASVEKFGVKPEEIIGERLHFDWQGNHFTFEVIGVMDDFNQVSLREPIVPLTFEVPGNTDGYNFMIASLNTSDFSQSISNIESLWQEQVSDAPFEYTFLDDDVQKQYHEDQRISSIITAFSIIAMIICSLGLYGLSSFRAERRLREIGIRKALGASVPQITGMMSKEFVKLVIVAFAIAVPLAWYGSQRWLEGFEYRTTLNITPFLFAGICALAIALITVSYESLKAANTDPAK